MFRKNNKSKNNTYKSFDSWLNSTKESINEFKDETHRELEEENNDKDKKHCFSKKGKCYRKSSDKADIKENFPKSQKTKMSRPIMDKRSYEGKVNSRGSCL